MRETVHVVFKEETKYAYKIWFGKHRKRRSFETPKRRWNYSMRVDLVMKVDLRPEYDNVLHEVINYFILGCIKYPSYRKKSNRSCRL
jgi:hypothetical protein